MHIVAYYYSSTQVFFYKPTSDSERIQIQAEAFLRFSSAAI